MNDRDFMMDELFLDGYELYSLRQEALEHYERALLSHQVTPFQHFIEGQLVSNPFHLVLLYDLSNDLHQQMLALQENLLDSRRRMVRAVATVYQTDISHLFPLDHPKPAFLSPETVVAAILRDGTKLLGEETRMLRELIHTNMKNFAQIGADIQLTHDLLDLLHDWLNAASLINLRQTQIPFWSDLTDGVSKIH